MSRPTSRLSDSPFLALQRELKAEIVIPKHEDGWRSIDELAEELGKSPRTAHNFLTKLRRRGLIETWERWCPNRTTRYRVKKKV